MLAFLDSAPNKPPLAENKTHQNPGLAPRSTHTGS